MGLSGRKTKQRIPNDPRNLSWADDANKFGAAYLQKLGWSAGTGLGTEGEGRTTHIKVQQKLDMLGIGAAHQRDPNGLAWKQNRDFENLLKRLNNGGMDAEEEKGTKLDGFYRATEGDKEEVKEGKEDKKEKKKRKRHEKDEEKAEVDEESEKKKDKKKRKKEKKEKKRKEDADTEDEEPSPALSIPTPTPPRPVRAHRARFLASKRLASKSATAIDEILGISRSGTSTPYPTTSLPESPPGSASPSPTPSPEDGLKLQELTTSSKSVMDYFREKLAAKSNSVSTSASSSSSPGPSTPRGDDPYDDYDDRPRGLGMGSARGGLGASKLRQEISFEEKVEETTTRAGLGAFSRMSAMFSAAKETTESKDEVTEQVTVEEKMEVDVVEVTEKKSRKKKDKGKAKELEAPEDDEGEVKEKSKKKSKKDRRKEDADEPVTESAAHDVEESSRKKKKKPKVAEPEDDTSSKKKKKSQKVKSQELVDDDS